MNPKKLLNPAYLYKHRHGYRNYFQQYLRRIEMSAVNSRYRLASYGLLLTENERKLAALKDKHQGQRCFVIGNGPSLRKTNLKALKNEITFGVNGLFLLFEEMGYLPTYYVVVDENYAEEHQEEINSITGTTKIFAEDLKHCLRPSPDTIYIRFIRDCQRDAPCFSPNALDFVCNGASVTYVNMQLAYYVGIRKVYLIGVDSDFGILDNVEDEVIVAHGEVTHFHPDYHRPGERWSAPRLDWQENAYRVAKRFFEEHGGIIYNATIGGKLEVFPRVSYEKVVCG